MCAHKFWGGLYRRACIWAHMYKCISTKLFEVVVCASFLFIRKLKNKVLGLSLLLILCMLISKRERQTQYCYQDSDELVCTDFSLIY